MLNQNEWRKFVSPTCPGPRSAHAVVATPAGGGKLYLFGGDLIFDLSSIILTYISSMYIQAENSPPYIRTRSTIIATFGVLTSRRIHGSASKRRSGQLRVRVIGKPVQACILSVFAQNSIRRGRMAMWKHYIVLFGGFYDPGIKSQCLAPSNIVSYLIIKHSELFERSVALRHPRIQVEAGRVQGH